MEICSISRKDLGRIVQVRYKPNTGNGWDDDFDWL